MGDFNIELLKAQVCHFAQNFVFTLQSHALTPTIDKPIPEYITVLLHRSTIFLLIMLKIPF